MRNRRMCVVADLSLHCGFDQPIHNLKTQIISPVETGLIRVGIRQGCAFRFRKFFRSTQHMSIRRDPLRGLAHFFSKRSGKKHQVVRCPFSLEEKGRKRTLRNRKPQAWAIPLAGHVISAPGSISVNSESMNLRCSPPLSARRVVYDPTGR